MDRCFDRQMKEVFLCFVVYLFLSIPVFIITLNTLHIMMIWNVLLSIIPLMLAKILVKNGGQKGYVKVIICLLWLFIFPNAPYIITDFIHISRIQFYTVQNEYAPIVYTKDIISWIKFIHIGIGVIFGTLAGLSSLSIIHNILIKKKGKVLAAIIIVIICLMSGYAIYIGRFLRFNSWDILHPISLSVHVLNDFNKFSLQYSLLFSFYILVSYIIFCVFYHNK